MWGGALVLLLGLRAWGGGGGGPQRLQHLAHKGLEGSLRAGPEGEAHCPPLQAYLGANMSSGG